jgi:hypothetical protein
MVYIDDQGIHHVLLVESWLLHVDNGSKFTVVEDPVV